MTTVTSTDVDASATATYTISGGADASKFAINASTGVLTFVSAPNFEGATDAGGNNVYDVQVTVSDGSLTDVQDIAVTVTNVNEAPVITSNGAGATASISVAENQTAVTTVTSTDVDASATATYTISGGADASKFTINALTGVLTFVSAPNFEGATDAGANNVYDVQVTVSDGSLTDVQDIAVTVTNVNEAPTDIVTTTYLSDLPYTVTQTVYDLQLDKDHGGGSAIVLDGVTYGKGLGMHPGNSGQGAGIINYALNGATSFKATIGVDDFIGGNVGSVIFKVTVDGVVKYTSGTLSTSSSLIDLDIDVSGGSTLTLEVTNAGNGNANDHAVWANARLEGSSASALTISENATNGQFVGSVVGVDSDPSQNWTYALLNSSGGRFAVDATTGRVSVADGTLLNYEAATSHSVVMQATDMNGLSFTKTMSISVTNLNEAPIITSNGGGTTAAISVAENLTAVTTVTSTDVDASATATYTISGGADASKFTINASTGVLTFVAGPDYENATDVGADNVYDVQVTVSDGSLTDVQDIAVSVTNANEAPVITSNGGGTTASVSVAENQTAVTTVTSTDVDASATATYSISGGADASKFSINSSTGVLTFVSAPNFEGAIDVGANNVYDVQVTVSDGSLTDVQDIAVTVTNVNEAPVITSNGAGATASISFAENQTAVTTVTSTDVDASATATYTISGGADASKFTINASTGVLTFVSAPNFEGATDAGANNVYDVQVTVSDGSLTDVQDIAVTVTNVNEAPVITSNGAGATASISVAENQTAVTTVTSTDVDASATATYTISGGADASKFAINASTGVLTFVSAPNFEGTTDAGANNVYDVQVTVSDGSLTDVQDIAVTVTNVNEAPVITSNGGGATARYPSRKTRRPSQRLPRPTWMRLQLQLTQSRGGRCLEVRD